MCGAPNLHRQQKMFPGKSSALAKRPASNDISAFIRNLSNPAGADFHRGLCCRPVSCSTLAAPLLCVPLSGGVTKQRHRTSSSQRPRVIHRSSTSNLLHKNSRKPKVSSATSADPRARSVTTKSAPIKSFGGKRARSQSATRSKRTKASTAEKQQHRAPSAGKAKKTTTTTQRATKAKAKNFDSKKKHTKTKAKQPRKKSSTVIAKQATSSRQKTTLKSGRRSKSTKAKLSPSPREGEEQKTLTHVEAESAKSITEAKSFTKAKVELLTENAQTTKAIDSRWRHSCRQHYLLAETDCKYARRVLHFLKPPIDQFTESERYDCVSCLTQPPRTDEQAVVEFR